VSDKIDMVLKMMSGGVPLLFTELFTSVASAAEKRSAATFLAVLELIRQTVESCAGFTIWRYRTEACVGEN